MGELVSFCATECLRGLYDIAGGNEPYLPIEEVKQRTNLTPVLRMIANVPVHKDIIRSGYELGISQSYRWTRYIDAGVMMFSTDLRLVSIIGSKRRVKNQIRFDDGNTSLDCGDCWTMAKRKVYALSTIFSRALEVLPDIDNRGQTDCSICAESMEGKEVFSCPNKHQIHLECWNNWTRSSGNRRCVVCRCDTATNCGPSREHLGHLLVVKPDNADDRAIGMFVSKNHLCGNNHKLRYFIDTLFRCPTTPKITEVCPFDATKIVMKTPVLEDYVDVLTYFRTEENKAYMKNIGYRYSTMEEMNEARMLTLMRQDYGSDCAMELLESNTSNTARNRLHNELYIRHYVMVEPDTYYISALKVVYERMLTNTSPYQNVSV